MSDSYDLFMRIHPEARTWNDNRFNHQFDKFMQKVYEAGLRAIEEELNRKEGKE